VQALRGLQLDANGSVSAASVEAVQHALEASTEVLMRDHCIALPKKHAVFQRSTEASAHASPSSRIAATPKHVGHLKECKHTDARAHCSQLPADVEEVRDRQAHIHLPVRMLEAKGSHMQAKPGATTGLSTLHSQLPKAQISDRSRQKIDGPDSSDQRPAIQPLSASLPTSSSPASPLHPRQDSKNREASPESCTNAATRSSLYHASQSIPSCSWLVSSSSPNINPTQPPRQPPTATPRPNSSSPSSRFDSLGIRLEGSTATAARIDAAMHAAHSARSINSSPDSAVSFFFQNELSLDRIPLSADPLLGPAMSREAGLASSEEEEGANDGLSRPTPVNRRECNQKNQFRGRPELLKRSLEGEEDAKRKRSTCHPSCLTSVGFVPQERRGQGVTGHTGPRNAPGQSYHTLARDYMDAHDSPCSCKAASGVAQQQFKSLHLTKVTHEVPITSRNAQCTEVLCEPELDTTPCKDSMHKESQKECPMHHHDGLSVAQSGSPNVKCSQGTPRNSQRHADPSVEEAIQQNAACMATYTSAEQDTSVRASAVDDTSLLIGLDLDSHQQPAAEQGKQSATGLSFPARNSSSDQETTPSCRAQNADAEQIVQSSAVGSQRKPEPAALDQGCADSLASKLISICGECSTGALMETNLILLEGEPLESGSVAEGRTGTCVSCTTEDALVNRLLSSDSLVPRAGSSSGFCSGHRVGEGTIMAGDGSSQTLEGLMCLVVRQGKKEEASLDILCSDKPSGPVGKNMVCSNSLEAIHPPLHKSPDTKATNLELQDPLEDKNTCPLRHKSVLLTPDHAGDLDAAWPYRRAPAAQEGGTKHSQSSLEAEVTKLHQQGLLTGQQLVSPLEIEASTVDSQREKRGGALALNMVVAAIYQSEAFDDTIDRRDPCSSSDGCVSAEGDGPQAPAISEDTFSEAPSGGSVGCSETKSKQLQASKSSAFGPTREGQERSCLKPLEGCQTWLSQQPIPAGGDHHRFSSSNKATSENSAGKMAGDAAEEQKSAQGKVGSCFAHGDFSAVNGPSSLLLDESPNKPRGASSEHTKSSTIGEEKSDPQHRQNGLDTSASQGTIGNESAYEEAGLQAPMIGVPGCIGNGKPLMQQLWTPYVLPPAGVWMPGGMPVIAGWQLPENRAAWGGYGWVPLPCGAPFPHRGSQKSRLLLIMV
jgi:hypothetical protein